MSKGKNNRPRKLIIINQASNYLTIGLCNAFAERFDDVTLLTGSLHVQGETLKSSVKVVYLNKWQERPAWRKMFSYLEACLRILFLLWFRFPKQEVFFLSIPPMGYLLNLLTPQRFSMLIWDVFPDAFKIIGMKENHPIYRSWGFLNKRSFQKAFRVFTIGQKMAELLAQYIPMEKLLITPIWSIFQENKRVPKADNPFIDKHNLQGKFIVQYSGNIGLSHRVEHMVELAEELSEQDHILFQIIGRGPRMPHLKKLVEEKDLPNCQFLPFQSDEMFPYSLSAADLGVVILDAEASKGSVPSKAYNLMSYGIPSLYLATPDSELYHYCQVFEHGECYAPDQVKGASRFILELSRDKTLQRRLSENAVKASGNFKRSNADHIVELYLEPQRKKNPVSEIVN